MRSKASLLLFGILVLAFILRLYRFDGPIADWHSWRQADTAAVSRNFVIKGFDILHPRFDDLSNVPSGIENPEGYRFVEFPIYNIFQAGLFTTFGFFTIEQWGRLVTIVASLLTTIFVYLLVKKHWSTTAGLLSAGFYAFLPFSIYYGRSILPDPSMMMCIMGGIWFFNLAVEKNFQKSQGLVYAMLAVLFTACALLLKPYALFFTVPMLYLAWEKYHFRSMLKWQLWVFLVVSVMPLIWWRLWMLQYSAGIPTNEWLLNGNGIRFRPAFFKWIGYERVVKLISGFSGVIFLVGGMVQVVQKKSLFLLSFAVSAVIYVVIIATGNVQHDYYQILILPSLAMLYGIGAEWMLRLGKNTKTVSSVGLVLVFIITFSMFYFSGNIVKDYFNINNRAILTAGEAVDRFTPKDAKVIAIYGGDTSFLYQTQRQGWASLQKPLDEMVRDGADYLVLVNPQESDFYFAKEYKILKHTDEYLLYDLHTKP